MFIYTILFLILYSYILYTVLCLYSKAVYYEVAMELYKKQSDDTTHPVPSRQKTGTYINKEEDEFHE